MNEAHAVKHGTLVERLRAQKTVDVALFQLGHHFGRWHHFQLHIGIGVEAVLGQVVAQQQVVDGELERDAQLHALPFFGVAVVLVLQAERDGLAVGVLDGGHMHARCRRTQAQRHGQRHGRQEVGGIELAVQHAVADGPPARRLHELHVQPLLFVQAQRVGHDERGGAGDGNEAQLEVFFLRRARGRRAILRHRFLQAHQCPGWQHRGNGGTRCARPHRPQKPPPHAVLRKQCLDQRGLHHAALAGLQLTRQAELLRGRRGHGLCGRAVLGHMPHGTTVAPQPERAVCVIQVGGFGHGQSHSPGGCGCGCE